MNILTRSPEQVQQNKMTKHNQHAQHNQQSSTTHSLLSSQLTATSHRNNRNRTEREKQNRAERKETRRKEEEMYLASLLGNGCAWWRRSPEAWPERRRPAEEGGFWPNLAMDEVAAREGESPNCSL